MKSDTTATLEPISVVPKYYEVDGALKANANKAWLLAFLTVPIALLAVGFAIFVRLQPPTVIRIGPNGEAAILGRPTKGSSVDPSSAGTDQFLNEAFAKRFLATYLNYSPADVDDQIDDDQIESVFHLRELDPVAGEPLTYLIYGVKDVHHLSKGTESTDHFVNEYRIRLIADRRSDVNPDGLWIAEYSERPIDGERRDRILNAPDATPDGNDSGNKGGQ